MTSTHGTTSGKPAVAQAVRAPGWHWALPETSTVRTVLGQQAARPRTRPPRALDGALVLAGALVAVWIGMTAPVVSPTAHPIGHTSDGQGNIDQAGSAAGDPGADHPPETETSPQRGGPGR